MPRKERVMLQGFCCTHLQASLDGVKGLADHHARHAARHARQHIQHLRTHGVGRLCFRAGEGATGRAGVSSGRWV